MSVVEDSGATGRLMSECTKASINNYVAGKGTCLSAGKANTTESSTTATSTAQTSTTATAEPASTEPASTGVSTTETSSTAVPSASETPSEGTGNNDGSESGEHHYKGRRGGWRRGQESQRNESNENFEYRPDTTRHYRHGH
jgi:hypothetical protein